MKVLCVFEKTQVAAHNSTQLHVLHKLKSSFITCHYVIKPYCVLTTRNGNIIIIIIIIIIYLLQLGCHQVAVVILHVHKT